MTIPIAPSREKRKSFKIEPVLAVDQTYDQLRAESGPRPWYIYGLLIARSVTMILGKGAAGKTMLALAVALLVCAGKSYAPWWKVKTVASGRKVLLVMAEDDKKEIQRRCLAICRVFGIAEKEWAGKLIIVTPTDAKALNIKLFEKLVRRSGSKEQFEISPTELCNQLPTLIRDNDACFCVIDPLREAHDLQENSNDEMIEVMKRLRDIASDVDVPLVVVHHDGKGDEAEDSTSGGRGASAMGYLARVTIRMHGMDELAYKELKNRLVTDRDHLDRAVFAQMIGDRSEYYQIVSGKSNYGPKTKGRYVRMLSVDTGIAADVDGDPTHVGVPVPVTVGANSTFEPARWAHATAFLAMIKDGGGKGGYPVSLAAQSALIVEMKRKFTLDGVESANMVEAFEHAHLIQRVPDPDKKHVGRLVWAVSGATKAGDEAAQTSFESFGE